MAYNTQPKAHQGMQTHPNPRNLPLDPEGRREWSNSFFDCCGDGRACLTATCCPCILYSRIKVRVGHLKTHGSAHPSGGDCCTGNCCIYAACLSLGFSCILQTIQRNETRARYNISGSGFTAFLAACCCPICDLVQESREIELEEESLKQ